MFGLYAAWVPLMPDQLASPSMVEAGKARIAAGKRKSSDAAGRQHKAGW